MAATTSVTGILQNPSNNPEDPPFMSQEAEMMETTKMVEKNENNLSESKNRAQMASSGALSLSLILLLKSLINIGPTFRYFYASIVLVSVCLLLQITAGILSLAMHSIKSKMEPRSQSRMVKLQSGAEYSENIFNTFPDNKQEEEGNNGKGIGTVNPSYSQDNTSIEMVTDAEATESDSKQKSSDAPKGKLPLYTTKDLLREFKDLDSNFNRPWYAPCFPCFKKQSDIVQEYTLDDAALRLYDILSFERLKAALAFTEAYIRNKNISMPGSEPVEDHTEPSKSYIAERAWKTLNVIRYQQRVVGMRVGYNKKYKLYKHLTAVQQGITYINYAIFVLNAFITGFGLTMEVSNVWLPAPGNTSVISP